MKNLIFILIFLITSGGFSQTIFDFEGAPPTFGDFNGSSTQVIANPDATGVNTSANVAENTIPANAAFAGVNIPITVIDLLINKGFTMNVWSPLANTPVLLKLESTTGPPHERLVNLTTTGAWEEISFDFSALTTETFDSVTVFMNFNQTDPATQVYFWDNLEQVSLAPPAPSLPITFEGGQLPVFGDFNGSFTQVIANPDATGVNTSANVAENTVPANAAFAGVNFPVGLIDLATDKGFTMNVWSPLANTPVLLKLESTTGPPHERLVNLTTTGAWEEISFDFSALTTGTFDSVTVFMNFNQTDPATQVYFWDNLIQVSAGTDPVEFPVDFENANAVYDVIGFEGADSAVEANAVQGGINTSPTVLRTIKTVGAQFFAGTVLALDVPIDFSASESIVIKTYSPKADIPVRLKLENEDGSQFIELDVNTTVVDDWEELTWDFTGMTSGIDFTKVVVLFEFIVDLPGDGSTYYFDDIEVFVPLGTDENTIVGFVFYPNPTLGIVNLSAESNIEKVEVYNMLGQIVINQSIDAVTSELNISELATETYLMKVTINGEVGTYRIVKE